MTKNWVTFRHGNWCSVNSSDFKWEECGTVTIDPGSVTTIVQYDIFPKGCTVYTGGQNYTTAMSREEMIAQIQSAL